MYIWQQAKWPEFTWDDTALSTLLAKANKEQGRLKGKLEAMGFKTQDETLLQTLTQDVIQSSDIEGEKLSGDQVRSSIARRLGMDIAGLVPADRNVEGVVEMMLDATQKYDSPLTAERLFAWQAALFPTGRSSMHKIIVGAWRDDSKGPMQVVSGPIGRERVHFEAPPAQQIPEESARFLEWFNQPKEIDPLLASGLAHLWFVSLHPFEDGNGRIARAIADMVLAQGESSAQRSYSMSAQIRVERDEYYKMLESTQQSLLDITIWQSWFLGCLGRAIEKAHENLDGALRKARFWERYSTEVLNERQIKVLNRLMNNFEGNLTSSRWAKIAKCSQDTAGRDINNLIERGALGKDPGGGRSTSYSIILD
ncbi:MAG: Fic family protein [Bacteroidia bacterium]|jgi:Fic family protein